MARLPNTRRPGSPMRAAAPPSVWAEAAANRWPAPPSRDAATPARCERLPPTERAATCALPICARPTSAALNPPPPPAPTLIPAPPPAPPTQPPGAPPHTPPPGPARPGPPPRPPPPAAAAVPAATAAAGVGFECEKRHDEEQHRGNASAARQHQLHGPAGLGAPHCRGRLGLGISPRTKSF